MLDKIKKSLIFLVAALQIGSITSCQKKEYIKDDEYEKTIEELNKLTRDLYIKDQELENLESLIKNFQSQIEDLNNLLQSKEFLEERINELENNEFEEYLKENNTATIDGELDLTGDYWHARRYKVGDEYHFVIDITEEIPFATNSDSRLKEIIDYLHLNYPGNMELNISLDKLITARFSDIPFEKFTSLNILPSEKMEIDENFTMPSFDGELTNVFFDAGTFEKISKEEIVKLFYYISKHNGNIIIDRLGTNEKAKIEEIADNIKDMHFKRFACYWVNNDCLDTFKYIPAETIVPVIQGKYSYTYLPNAKYVLNDTTNNLSLYGLELKKGISVESNHSINLDLNISGNFYDVKFNLPKDSNININCYDDYVLFTENTLKNLENYNVNFNNGKTLKSDVSALKEMNTLSKNIKLEMLENKEYRRFKITLNIPEYGINDSDFLALQNIISFCNEYDDYNHFDDLVINAYNKEDIQNNITDHLYFNELRNVTFNNYGGNISFLNIFSSSNGCGYTNLTFNNYSKVNDYDLLNKVVSKYTHDNGTSILNNVNEIELNITYGYGSKEEQDLPSEAQVEKLVSYGYSEDEAWRIVDNKEYDKIFYFYVYINGEKYKISYEKTYSLKRIK